MPTHRKNNNLRSIEDLLCGKEYVVWFRIPGPADTKESNCGHFQGVFTRLASVPIISADPGRRHKHRMVACFKEQDSIDIAYIIAISEIR